MAHKTTTLTGVLLFVLVSSAIGIPVKPPSAKYEEWIRDVESKIETSISTYYSGFIGSLVVPTFELSYWLTVEISVYGEGGAALYMTYQNIPPNAPQVILESAVYISNTSSTVQNLPYKPQAGDVINFWSTYVNGEWTMSVVAPGQEVVSFGPKRVEGNSNMATVSFYGYITSCSQLPAEGHLNVITQFETQGVSSAYTIENREEGPYKCNLDAEVDAPNFTFTWTSS